MVDLEDRMRERISERQAEKARRSSVGGDPTGPSVLSDHRGSVSRQRTESDGISMVGELEAVLEPVSIMRHSLDDLHMAIQALPHLSNELFETVRLGESFLESEEVAFGGFAWDINAAAADAEAEGQMFELQEGEIVDLNWGLEDDAAVKLPEPEAARLQRASDIARSETAKLRDLEEQAAVVIQRIFRQGKRRGAVVDADEEAEAADAAAAAHHADAAAHHADAAAKPHAAKKRKSIKRSSVVYVGKKPNVIASYLKKFRSADANPEVDLKLLTTDEIHKLFTKFDKNRDKVLDKEETYAFFHYVADQTKLPRVPDLYAEKLFAEVDENEDGVYTRDEFVAGFNRFWSAYVEEARQMLREERAAEEEKALNALRERASPIGLLSAIANVLEGLDRVESCARAVVPHARVLFDTKGVTTMEKELAKQRSAVEAAFAERDSARRQKIEDLEAKWKA